MNFRDFLKGNFISEAKIPAKFKEPYHPKSIKYLEKVIKDDVVPLDKIIIYSPTKVFSNQIYDSLRALFRGTKRTHFSGLETWDLNYVFDLGQMFQDVKTFTGKEIEKWNVLSSRTFDYMFAGCDKFNADLSKWKLSPYVRHNGFYKMFSGCKSFTGKGLEHWEIHNTALEQLVSTFEDCVKFTGKSVEKWNVSKIDNLKETFKGCVNFNADLSRWDVSEVIIMESLFEGCKSFTGKGLEKWDLSNVKNCKNIFKNSGVKNIPENFMRKFEELGLDWKGEIK